MIKPDDVSLLSGEYHAFLQGIADNIPYEGPERTNLIKNVLIKKGDWTPSAADHLIALASNYGSFMLRNALALSLAMEIEDGKMGF